MALKAKVDPATASRADAGKVLRAKTIGRFIEALGAIPVLDGPIELVKAS